jgi:hypothetical protein
VDCLRGVGAGCFPRISHRSCLSGRADCFSDSIAEIVLVSFVAWPDPICCKEKKKEKGQTEDIAPGRTIAPDGRGRLGSGLAHERALTLDAHAWIAGLPSGPADLQLGSISRRALHRVNHRVPPCAWQRSIKKKDRLPARPPDRSPRPALSPGSCTLAGRPSSALAWGVTVGAIARPPASLAQARSPLPFGR